MGTKRTLKGWAKELYRIYQRNALRRRISWRLTRKALFLIVNQPCTYCGKKPANSMGNFYYSGIDRKDNNKGYAAENCIPCCKECNKIKSNLLSFEEMLEAMKAVKRVRGRKLPLKK